MNHGDYHFLLPKLVVMAKNIGSQWRAFAYALLGPMAIFSFFTVCGDFVIDASRVNFILQRWHFKEDTIVVFVSM
jgi:hypothetical protein